MCEKSNMRWVTAVFVTSVLLAHHAHAQSSVDVGRAIFAPVHQYVAAEAIPTQLAMPANITVTPMYRALVDTMLRDSPTFRRQCVRLAGENSLTVVLVIGSHVRRSDLRATTAMKRTEDGRLTALVEIPPLKDLEELIAHEFEHIIEQLDGVDLAAQAARPQTGVTQIGPRRSVFETVRATRMGLKVAAELQQ